MIRPRVRGVNFENIAIYAGRPRTSRTEESIDVVQNSVRENPTQSIRKCSRTLNMPRSALQRILKKDKKFHLYQNSASIPGSGFNRMAQLPIPLTRLCPLSVNFSLTKLYLEEETSLASTKSRSEFNELFLMELPLD
ncbi:hypothetical protein EVAR_93137_1 [Eumeta japonica]|uniref:Uncharacterized protein n=1 Tax=Eumeta variegata TaxID=151549 RepID=A0A4C1TFD2_EUMVA|nr:hypothetical protein EVAR_93137_1 [Eumeta japonica]